MAIFKKGPNWYIDYYLYGRRRRKKIGPSKRLAELALKNIKVAMAKGEHLGIYDSKKISFEELAKQYLPYAQTNKTPRSYERDVTNLKALTPHFAGLITEIKPQDIEAYKAVRLAAGVKPATVNHELDTLRHMLTMAAR